MHERNEPGRIEIELTSNEPGGVALPSRNGEDTPLVARPIAERADGDDRRLLGVAALVGVVGLVAGVVIGRAGREEAAPSTTAPPTTEQVGPADQPIAVPSSPTIPTVTSPPSSPRSRPTLTTLVEPRTIDDGESTVVPPVEASVVIEPTAAQLPIEVVGRAVGGDMVRVDLATGRTTTYPLDALGGPPVVLAGDGWSAIPTWDGRDGWTVVSDQGAVSSVDMAGVVPGWRHATDGLFWARDERTAASEVLEVDITGSPTGRVIELQGTPQFADPRGGGLVVLAPGGTYIAGETVRTRLTSGRVVALGRERTLAYECDEALVCGHVVIDRTTGERRSIEFSIEPGSTIEALASWSTASPVNDADDAVLVLVNDPATGEPPRGGIVDLRTGAFTQIAERGDAALMRWAPDGRRVIWLDRGRLRLFDPTTADSVDVAADLALLTAFTVRTVVPSVDGS